MGVQVLLLPIYKANLEAPFTESVPLLESSWKIPEEVSIELVYQNLNKSSSLALLVTTNEGNIAIVDKEFKVMNYR
jgi:hypothetical protein